MTPQDREYKVDLWFMAIVATMRSLFEMLHNSGFEWINRVLRFDKGEVRES